MYLLLHALVFLIVVVFIMWGHVHLLYITMVIKRQAEIIFSEHL